MPTRTVSNTGGNWNATTTWVGGVVPIASDDVAFTATSGNLTVNVSTAQLVGINFTSYVGTITFSGFNINVAGTVNLGTGGYTQAGASGGLNINGTTSLTTNGVTWTRGFVFSGAAGTLTLVDTLNVSNLVIGPNTGVYTINSNSINIFGNLTLGSVAANTVVVEGTTTINLKGTGTWSSANASGNPVGVNINIDAGANTVTCTGVLGIGRQSGSMTFAYISGTVNATGATLHFNRASSTTTVNLTSAVTWGAILISQTGITVTLTGDLYAGSFSSSTSGTINTSTSKYMYISGNCSYSSTSSITGTSRIVLTGTGTLQTSSTGFFSIFIDINAPSATRTISGTFRYGSVGTFTYTAGEVVTTGSTLLLVNSTSSLNTVGMSWWNVTFGTSPHTCTLLSNLQLSGTLTMGGTVTTSGAFNIYCENCIMNNSISGGSVGSIALSTDIYVNNTLTVGPGPGNFLGMSGTKTIYVYGDVNLSIQASSAFAGDCPIRLSGTGTFTSIAGFWRLVPIIFDTPGRITLSGSFLWNGGGSGSQGQRITYIKGTIIGKNASLFLGINTGNPTYTNMNCIPWANVNLTSGFTYTMNEFFSGTPSYRTFITPSSTTNYIIAFTDNFEKLARFVEVRNCTITRPNQLLLLTNSKNKGTNSGIRYINQSPNGIAKNRPTVPDPMTYPAGGLVQDPNFVV